MRTTPCGGRRLAVFIALFRKGGRGVSQPKHLTGGRGQRQPWQLSEGFADRVWEDPSTPLTRPHTPCPLASLEAGLGAAGPFAPHVVRRRAEAKATRPGADPALGLHSPKAVLGDSGPTLDLSGPLFFLLLSEEQPVLGFSAGRESRKGRDPRLAHSLVLDILDGVRQWQVLGFGQQECSQATQQWHGPMNQQGQRGAIGAQQQDQGSQDGSPTGGHLAQAHRCHPAVQMLV